MKTRNYFGPVMAGWMMCAVFFSALTVSAQTYTIWQLGGIQFKDHYNGWAQKANLVRILRQEAHSGGGLVYLEAVDVSRPGSVCRYKFTWTFERDVTRIAYTDRSIPVGVLIEGDGGACVNMDPWMEFGTSGPPVLESTPETQFHYNPRHVYHDGKPRMFRVKVKEGLTKNLAMVVTVYVSFRPREETLRLRVTYPYEGLTGGGGSTAAGLAGTQWQQCETYTQQICGSWTFDSDSQGRAQWGGVQATISIAVRGREVIITRRDRASSLQATYRGTLSPDGTQISGQVDWCCDGHGNRSGRWMARIIGGRR